MKALKWILDTVRGIGACCAALTIAATAFPSQTAAAMTLGSQPCIIAASEEDVWLVAITAAAEARGEPLPGIAMALVAEVVRNRVCAQLFGDDTVREVVLRKWQFSAWNADSPMLADLKQLARGESARARDLEVSARKVMPEVRAILEGRQDLVLDEGVLHYAALDFCAPAWADRARIAYRFGRHTFFADVP